jgi:hypothetical protein
VLFPIPTIIQSWRLRGSEKLEYFISSLYSYTLRLQMTVCCLSTATCELINVKADRTTPSVPSHSYPHLYGVAPRQKKNHTSLTSNTERMKRRTQGTHRPYFIRQISCYFTEQLSTLVWASRQTSCGNTIDEPTETCNQYLSHKIMTMYQVLGERYKCDAERIDSA